MSVEPSVERRIKDEVVVVLDGAVVNQLKKDVTVGDIDVGVLLGVELADDVVGPLRAHRIGIADRDHRKRELVRVHVTDLSGHVKPVVMHRALDAQRHAQPDRQAQAYEPHYFEREALQRDVGVVRFFIDEQDRCFKLRAERHRILFFASTLK